MAPKFAEFTRGIEEEARAEGPEASRTSKHSAIVSALAANSLKHGSTKSCPKRRSLNARKWTKEMSRRRLSGARPIRRSPPLVPPHTPSA